MTKQLTLSSLMHLLLILLLFFSKNLLLSGLFGRKDVLVVPLEPTIRVDVVGLPKHTLRELRSLRKLTPPAPIEGPAKEKNEEEVKAPAESKKPEVADEKSEKSEKAETVKEGGREELLKKMGKQKTEKKSATDAAENQKTATAKSGKKEKIGSALSGLILAGNQISQGTALTGKVGQDKDFELSQYIQSLLQQIRPQWKLPPLLAQQQLKCRIRVMISAHGELSGVELFESSGNSNYDERAIDAVRQSAPFPRPPANYQEKISEGMIVLGFPL